MNPAMELSNATKRYGNVTALDRVSFEVEAGKVTSILGPNGAGKTTAVRLLLGLSHPTSGSATLLGGNPLDAAVRMRTGAMMQVAQVPDTLRVAEHLELFSSYYPAPLPPTEVLRIAGLEGLERRPFGKLSGGQKQRTLFALSICGDPQVLFLDEPTVGLDVAARRTFWNHIRGLARSGRTIILTTHYLEEADALADRILVLSRGRVVADGTPTAIKAQASGTRISARTRLDEDLITSLPGVRSVRREGEEIELLTSEAETVTRELLSRDPSLTDLRITRAGLEEAFLDLVAEDEPVHQGAA